MKQKQMKQNYALPKWPAIVVVGEPVTREQAAEILVRTDSLYFSYNDPAFHRDLYAVLYGLDPRLVGTGYDGVDAAVAGKLGLDPSERGMKVYEYRDMCHGLVGQLPLSYLHNSRICSAWVGGPHGWCDWDGRIGCNNYNIGKWPSAEEVRDEWKTIARAFPFLDLRCQLMNHEAGCDDMVESPAPVVEFRVKGGRVRTSRPKRAILEPTGEAWENIGDVFTLRRERGCTLETFRDAVRMCQDKTAAAVAGRLRAGLARLDGQR